MRFVLALITLTATLMSAPLRAEAPGAVALTSDFMEKAGVAGWQVVDSRSYTARFGAAFQFSMGSFGCTFTPELTSDSAVSLEFQLSSFDYNQRNYFDWRTVAVGAATFFDSVLVRERSFYRVRIKVDSLVDPVSDCQYHFNSADFSSDPSGDFDFYFISNSLGDYRWNQIRDAMELNYDYIRDQIDFVDPTRVNFYISPCRVSDVGWDDRWDNALDLSRNNVFAHYTHGINTLQVESVFKLKLLRLWGYAPSLVLEGTASLVEFCDAFAQDYRKEGKLPTLADLTISKDFRAFDRDIGTHSAGSFVRFLINSRGLPTFRSFYDRATDLTTKPVFKEIYGEELSEMEVEWHHYLDTLQLGPELFDFYRYRASGLMKYDDALVFLSQQLGLTGDTLRLGSQLANFYFYYGDYAGAEEVLVSVAAHDSAGALTHSYLGNLQLTQGKIKEAEASYRRAMEQDTSNSYQPSYKLGLIERSRGNLDESLKLLRRSLEQNSSIPIRVDIRLGIGDVLMELGQPDSARPYFQAALDTAKLLLGNFNDRPLYHLRVGKAALRLGEGELALENLQIEFFLEERMYYIGQILLAMGQAHDVLGQRDEAKEQYRKIFLYPTAWLDQQDADKHMKVPYFYE